MRLSSLIVICAICSVSAASLAQAPAPLTSKSLQAALAAKPEGTDADALAERIRAYFGGSEALMKGGAPKIDELTVAWALEAPQLAPNVPVRVVADVGSLNLPMVKVGTTGVYAAVANLSHGAAMTWHYEAGPDRRLGGSQLEVYETHPDSRERPDVPKGTVKQMSPWQSKVFDGTKRDWWVYVPAQYRPENPAAVMVFQDGAGPKDYVPTVFDNLIAKGDIPVLVGIFINPGVRADGGANRSFEYDTLSDQYARFLLEEILPWIGSFTNIAAGQTLRAGGHNYEALVRKTIPRKPIRVFLQDGENDLDNANGNWPLANQTLAKSLAFAGYDYKFELVHGFHSNRHGRAILPDSLRWLWRDYRP
ncbi:MAG: enterochelin esterase [Acidobacteria bacterium]|nr:enterochelin esterase [Acidobacteriota bacterium]